MELSAPQQHFPHCMTKIAPRRRIVQRDACRNPRTQFGRTPSSEGAGGGVGGGLLKQFATRSLLTRSAAIRHTEKRERAVRE